MLVPAEVWTVAKAEQGNAVLVRPLGLDVAVPIFIAPLEAQSILIGLGSVKMPRPLTHDLFITVLESLESSVNRVEITSLQGRHLLREAHPRVLGLGDRGGRAAVRLPCPCRAGEVPHLHRRSGGGRGGHLGEDGGGEEPGAQAGATSRRAPSEEAETPAGRRGRRPAAGVARWPASGSSSQAAIEEENYEEAARLRDKIRELEST